MNTKKTFRFFYPALIACLALASCASRPELAARGSAVPSGADISGLWRLREDPDSKPIPRGDPERGIRMPTRTTMPSAAKRRPKRSSGSDVTMFLETGESLKISQTPDGLFISFDRAIVEEYTFGENRTVSVGPIEAQRVSGWDGMKFVVETLDDQGVLLTESWYLEPGNNVLVRDILVGRGDDQRFASRQRFDRI